MIIAEFESGVGKAIGGKIGAPQAWRESLAVASVTDHDALALSTGATWT